MLGNLLLGSSLSTMMPFLVSSETFCMPVSMLHWFHIHVSSLHTADRLMSLKPKYKWPKERIQLCQLKSRGPSELWPGRQSHELKPRSNSITTLEWWRRGPNLPQMHKQLVAESVLEPAFPQDPRSGDLFTTQSCLILHIHGLVTVSKTCSVIDGIRTGKRYQNETFLWVNGRVTHRAECSFLKERE